MEREREKSIDKDEEEEEEEDSEQKQAVKRKASGRGEVEWTERLEGGKYEEKEGWDMKREEETSRVKRTEGELGQ